MLEKRVYPMAWSPLAGGRIFKGEDETSVRVRKVLNKVKGFRLEPRNRRGSLCMDFNASK